MKLGSEAAAQADGRGPWPSPGGSLGFLGPHAATGPSRLARQSPPASRSFATLGRGEFEQCVGKRTRIHEHASLRHTRAVDYAERLRAPVRQVGRSKRKRPSASVVIGSGSRPSSQLQCMRVTRGLVTGDAHETAGERFFAIRGDHATAQRPAAGLVVLRLMSCAKTPPISRNAANTLERFVCTGSLLEPTLPGSGGRLFAPTA
jgi:hypothetical protein